MIRNMLQIIPQILNDVNRRESMEWNKDIRAAAKDSGVKLWQIGEVLGLRDYEFTRLLRRELAAQQRDEMFAIIEVLRGQNSGNS